jgi:uncharacterized protein YcbX
MRIGTVDALWRYPVKGLAAEPLDAVEIESDGLAGDRRAALLVADAAHARAGKPFRGKEHNLLHTATTLQAARDLGAAAGVTLEPVGGERYFDAQPVSLIWDLWLQDVETLVGRRLDPLRYRPNIFIRATPPFGRREPDLVGATIAVGGAVLQVVATIGRCITTTYDVATGQRDADVLRAVAQQRANTVGVYCTVMRTGTATIGDAVSEHERSIQPRSI